MVSWRPSRTDRSAVLWWLAGFALLQVVLAVGIGAGLPGVRDPEFAARKQRLDRLLAAAPDRPLVLMLGSSRTQLGFQAGRLSALLEEEGVLAFNFGMPGVGPLLQRVCLERLLADGIRPRLLLLEVIPPLLSRRRGQPMEEQLLDPARLQPAEVVLLQPYCVKGWQLVRRWGDSQYRWATQRGTELRTSGLLGPATFWEGPDDAFAAMDNYGWRPVIDEVNPEQRSRYTHLACSQYRTALEHFELGAEQAAALRDLLAVARQAGLPTALVLMPEGTTFRSLYPPPARQTLDGFLADLCRQTEIPLIDARDWVADRDFYDSHHLLPSGAQVFTGRLAHEAILPLLREPSHRRLGSEEPLARADG